MSAFTPSKSKTAWQNAQDLDIHLKREAAGLNPLIAPTSPVPSLEERAHLLALRANLTELGEKLAELDSRTTKFSHQLPEAIRRVSTMEATVEPDSQANEILNLLVENRRIQILKNFVASAGERRTKLGEQVQHSLVALAEVCAKISGSASKTLHFTHGHTLPVRITLALSAINEILK